ncbi:hypothetical protein [Billgrantia montanilacus]|uniref:Uncharacterized protein n=1 Tax=Billgrantia montanilacus TaxID=2282305 RepID=A0A368TW67_9GAMM|nr:hypothetical protein [Halomonas montanilacus]RCV88940.1 hypothetical protein DU505_12625 [Halomonas montanilacus]
MGICWEINIYRLRQIVCSGFQRPSQNAMFARRVHFNGHKSKTSPLRYGAQGKGHRFETTGSDYDIPNVTIKAEICDRHASKLMAMPGKIIDFLDLSSAREGGNPLKNRGAYPP